MQCHGSKAKCHQRFDSFCGDALTLILASKQPTYLCLPSFFIGNTYTHIADNLAFSLEFNYQIKPSRV